MTIITGGIGAGKSVVSRMLRLLGHKVFDCDYEAARIMSESADVRKFVAEEFGDDHLEEEKGVNRNKIRETIFNDNIKRERLNRKVHHEVRKEIQSFIDMNGKRCFVESAIPATGGLLRFADEVWIVDALESLRIQRVDNRSHLSADTIKAIMATQQLEIESVIKTGLPYAVLNNNDDGSLMVQLFACLTKMN